MQKNDRRDGSESECAVLVLGATGQQGGAATGNADIAGLTLDFGPMVSLDSWLAGEGKTLIQSATGSADV